MGADCGSSGFRATRCLEGVCNLQMSLTVASSVLPGSSVYSPYNRVHDKDADTTEPSSTYRTTLFWVQATPTVEAELTDSVNLKRKLPEVTDTCVWASLNLFWYHSVVQELTILPVLLSLKC